LTALFALTTRGLEFVTAREIERLRAPGVTIEAQYYRRVVLRCAEGSHGVKALRALLTLRTPDDLFLHLADWPAIPRGRDALADLRGRSRLLDLKPALHTLLSLRPVPRAPRFAVTVSFVGARKTSAPELKAALAAGISARYPAWTYAEDDAEADLNLRLFIDGDDGLVGLRLSRDPLGRRAYKAAHQPGSLKPTVAAAMLLLTEARAGVRLLDPCCGAGTILAEGAALGLRPVGGDLALSALVGGAANLRAAGARAALARWNVARLPLATASVDLAASNLPWGQQVAPEADLRQFYADVVGELRRVVVPGGPILLLTSRPDALPEPPRERVEISLYGQTPILAVL
jgi:23S rRNA G2445 N2-methylase RlmL